MEIDWEDSTPIELRVERLRGAIREIGKDISMTAKVAAEGIGRVEARLSKQEEILERVDTYMEAQKGAESVRKSVTAWIKPVVTTLIAGIVAWAAVTIWGSRSAPAKEDIAAEVVKVLNGSVKISPPPSTSP